MITVIVPTMWRGQELTLMLPQLNDHPLVGEIILIDNCPAEKNENLANLSKVRYLTFGKNIYVVPAWNCGWKLAKHDKLMFINDDVMFDIAIVEAMDNKISPDVGTVTINVDFVRAYVDLTANHNLVEQKEIYFNKITRLRNRAAIITGIHKTVYEEIPEELLIHYGDYFLFKICELRNKCNLNLSGAIARTVMSTTVKMFSGITDYEYTIFRKLFSEYGIENA